MIFGEGYTPMESSTLEAGNTYIARIDKVEPKVKNTYEWVEVSVSILGHPGCYPNSIKLNYQPIQVPSWGGTLEQARASWNKHMTVFFDAFGIQRGDFDFNHWRGKIGTVKCTKQKDSEYLQLNAFKKEGSEIKAEQPKANKVEQLKQAVGGEEFPEDIPF